MIIKLDIAFTALQLIRFNTNPSPKYYKADN